MPKKKVDSVYSMVWVEWVDSCEPADNSEIERHEIPEVQRIYQVGFLIRDTESSISVGGAWKPDLNTFDYVITIPKFAISQMKTIG
jgi:hypothetical protein